MPKIYENSQEISETKPRAHATINIQKYNYINIFEIERIREKREERETSDRESKRGGRDSSQPGWP